MEEAHKFYDGVEPDEYIDAERIEIYMDPNVNTITVGGAVVSDDPANENIVAVAEAAGVKAESLVSLVADGNAPLVFEFADPTERNEVTLQNVYFINGDGKVTMPSRKDNDNILAFRSGKSPHKSKTGRLSRAFRFFLFSQQTLMMRNLSYALK